MSCKSCNDKRLLHLLEKQERRRKTQRRAPPYNEYSSDSEDDSSEEMKDRMEIENVWENVRKDRMENSTFIERWCIHIGVLLIVGPFVLYPLMK